MSRNQEFWKVKRLKQRAMKKKKELPKKSKKKKTKLYILNPPKKKVTPVLSQEQQAVKGRAECLWRMAGCPTGDDDRFWIAAEQEIKKEKKRLDAEAQFSRDKRDAEQREREKVMADNNEKSFITFTMSLGLGLICCAFTLAVAILLIEVEVSAKEKAGFLITASALIGFGMWSFFAGCVRVWMRNPFVIKPQCMKCYEAEQQAKIDKVLGAVRRFDEQEEDIHSTYSSYLWK